MKPYFEQSGISIYLGDCREVVPELRDTRIDTVLTDPPYSERTHRGARTNRYHLRGRPFLDFDHITEPELLEVFSLCATTLRGWFITFIDWKYVSGLEREPPTRLRFVRMGIWNKPDGAPQLTGDRPAMGWEAIAILHSTSSRLRWNGGGHRAVWTCLREKRALHPAQKPLRLVKQLAALFTQPGELILDPFMGSGTTLRAAADVGCRAIGIELDERYCEIAANRLRQQVLF